MLLPIAEWKLLLEQLEELEDVRAYDAAKANQGDSIPLVQAMVEIRAEWEKTA